MTRAIAMQTLGKAYEIFDPHAASTRNWTYAILIESLRGIKHIEVTVLLKIMVLLYCVPTGRYNYHYRKVMQSWYS
jgi:hypothetical protein